MISPGRRASFSLFTGDVVVLCASLYLTLWVRYFSVPTPDMVAPYIVPFAFLLVVWLLVFYSAGLYSKRISLFPSRLPDALFKTQLVNIIIAALFFFFVPQFGLAPKTILLLYLVFSLLLLSFWRIIGYPRLPLHTSLTRAVLLASGDEADELFTEVNGNHRYGLLFVGRDIPEGQVSVYVVDREHLDVSLVTGMAQAQVIPFEDMYEEVFDRLPLSRMSEPWFREELMVVDPWWYLALKRAFDLIGGVLMAVITILVTPFVALALQVEYPGAVFFAQTRIGQNGSRIRAYKFRSMRFVDQGAWKGENENTVTRVGAFLRKTSLDEFPQCVNVLLGQLSLIGPRNDVESLGLRLSEALPYYMLRYSVKPGITGWAQINQQYEQGNVSPQSIKETRVRLAYDFYYLKHRSFGLDVIIALKTMKRMFFRLSSV